MKVTAAIDEYRYYITKHSEETQKWYLSKLKAFSKWCDEQELELEDIKPTHVGQFLDEIRTHTNPRTNKPVTSHLVNGYARTIKTFLSWCSREDGLEDLVSQRLPKRIVMPKIEQKVMDTLTNDQIKAMFLACEKEFTPELVMRDRAILSVLIDTGIRASELCCLTLDNVFLTPQDGYLKVYGKGSKWREVGLGEKSRAALNRYITRYRRASKDERHVFLSRYRLPMTRNGLDQLLHRLAEWGHVKGRVSAHVWRHSYAMNYLLNDGDVYKLSRLMGHTSVSVTENYLRAVKQRDTRIGRSVLDNLR